LARKQQPPVPNIARAPSLAEGTSDLWKTLSTPEASNPLVSQQARKQNTKYETASDHGNPSEPGYSAPRACSGASISSQVSRWEVKHCRVVSTWLIKLTVHEK